MSKNLGSRRKPFSLKYTIRFGCMVMYDSVVIPILKPGQDPNLSESYRPIVLLSCSFKTLERIIKLRIESFLQGNFI